MTTLLILLIFQLSNFNLIFQASLAYKQTVSQVNWIAPHQDLKQINKYKTARDYKLEQTNLYLAPHQ